MIVLFFWGATYRAKLDATQTATDENIDGRGHPLRDFSSMWVKGRESPSRQASLPHFMAFL